MLYRMEHLHPLYRFKSAYDSAWKCPITSQVVPQGGSEGTEKKERNCNQEKNQTKIDTGTIQEEPDFSCIPQEAPDYEWMSAIAPPPTIPLQPGLSLIVPLMPTTTTTTTTTSHPTPSISDESLEFANKYSRNYFTQEIKDYGGGGRHLVAKSFYRGETKTEDLEEDNAEICLQLP
jgi:hypothetical protein